MKKAKKVRRNGRFSRVSFSGARFLAILFFAVLSLGCLTPATLLAQFLGSWPNNQFTFQVNPNFPDLELSGSPEHQVQLILCAAKVWEQQTTVDFRMNYGGVTALTEPRDDSVNSLLWVDADSDGALAATLIDFRVIQGEVTDLIRGFDILFYKSLNGNTINWQGLAEPGFGETDIVGVTVHELGHAIGLDHIVDKDENGNELPPSSTMSAFAFGRALPMRTLGPADRAAIEELYGTLPGAPLGVEITDVFPPIGPTEGGFEVVLSGNSFTYDSDSELLIDGLIVSTTRWSIESCDKLVIFDMPPHGTSSVDITISNETGEFTLPNGFRYGDPPPQVIAVEPAVGPLSGGITVTFTGERFSDAAVILVDGQPLLDAQFIDETTIIGTLPAGTTTGEVDISVTVSEDTTTLADAFSYNAFELKIPQTFAAAGAAVSLDITASSPDPLASASFGLVFDPNVITLSEISVESTAAANADAAFASIDNVAGTATFNLVMSFTSSSEFPAGTDVLMARIIGDTAPTVPPGTTSTIEIADRIGSPPTLLKFERTAFPGEQLVPSPVPGQLTIGTGVLFLRGDSNEDTLFNIADAVFILNHLFDSGAASHCEKAMDANDEWLVNIADPVRVLNALFAGESPLPAPHPESGVDPTPDTIPCDPA